MKRKLYTLLACILIGNQVNAQCSGNELSGTVAIVAPAKEKLLTYNIYHGFTLMPATATLPVVKAITYNHALVKETGLSCLDGKVVPQLQPAGYDSLKKDTMIDDIVYNNQVPVNYKIAPISPAGTMGTMTDSAYASSCVSKAKASTCITVNPFAAGVPLTGEIQTYGFGQSINPPYTSDPFAISVGDVTAESTKKLRSGAIIWIPWIESTSGGKAHGIRQKAGTSDPITYFVHNYNTGLDTSGTLLTISMVFYTDTDTFTYVNKWRNDTVRIESDSAEFHINFPSTLTSMQGSLYVKVDGGIVTQATGTGVFGSVPLPLIGSPTPVVFPLQNILNFNYDLGTFNNDSLLVIINMFGNPINNHVPASIPIQINDSIVSPKCFGQLTGAIYTNVTGSYPPFTYLWNSGSHAKNRFNLKAKTYTVTVTDAIGNSVSKSIVVTQPPKLNFTFSKTNVKCGGNSTGSATVNVSGGTPPYSYLWNTGDVTSTIATIPAGVYIATVTDANLCTLVKTTVITENPILSLIALPLGGDSAMAIALGGVPPYNFKWFTTPQQLTPTAYGLLGGIIYKVKVTDNKNCTSTIFYTHPFSRNGTSQETENNISVIPNPTSGLVTIIFESEESQKHSIKLYDITGKLLFEKEITEKGNSFNFDFSWLQKGIYLVSIGDGEKTKILKLIRN